jgi:hypothetical protein
LIDLFPHLARSIHDYIPPSSLLTKLTAAELSLVFHGVHHGHSYISQSCTIDLLKKIFNESNIGQNITCGKTKSRDLAVNILGKKIPYATHAKVHTCFFCYVLILAPFFTSKIIEQIHKSFYYSLSFDGSTKTNVKMFPFIINYFTVESGITRSVLEVLEQPRESAEHIVAALHDVLTKNNIDIQQMTSIGADNTNTNYGRHHSVFSIIKLEVLNLLKGNDIPLRNEQF